MKSVLESIKVEALVTNTLSYFTYFEVVSIQEIIFNTLAIENHDISKIN